MNPQIVICPQCHEVFVVEPAAKDSPYVTCENCDKMIFPMDSLAANEVAETIDYNVDLATRLAEMDKLYKSTDDPMVRAKLKVEQLLRYFHLQGQMHGMLELTADQFAENSGYGKKPSNDSPD